MRVRLKFFAYLRETLGIKEEEMEVEEGTKVSQLWSAFKDRLPANEAFRILFAVNGEYAEEERELKDGDEVVFIPPVSGGIVQDQ